MSGTASLLAAVLAGATLVPVTPQSIDTARSDASFRVSVRLPIRIEGSFERVEGALTPAADGHWQVAASVDARALRFRGPAWLATTTASPDFLDSAQHPRIAFLSRPIPAAHLREGGPLPGWLTLRGQRREVEFSLLPASCDSPGRDCPVQLAGTINRFDFGMTAHRFSVGAPVRFRFRIHWKDSPP